MKRVQAVVRPERLEAVQHRLGEAGFHGMMVVDVRGHGSESSSIGEYRGAPFAMSVKHKLLVDLVVEDDEVLAAVHTITEAAKTGSPGDGLIFVMDVAAVYQIRTAAEGGEAIRA